MGFVSKTVDKTTVNYDMYFTYTYNVSFSGTVGSISNAKLIDNIPTIIDYDIQNLDSTVNVTTRIVGSNTEITFDFGAITDLGVAYNFNIQCKFKSNAPIGTTFINSGLLYINNSQTPDYIAYAPLVKLDVVGKWGIQKIIVSPANSDPIVGGSAFYSISLRNFGDFGAILENFKVIDNVPLGMTIDPSFTPIGINRDGGNVVPASIIGSINGQTITWSFDSYSGNYYTMIFKVMIDSNLVAPTTLINNVQLIGSDDTVIDFWDQPTTISQIPEKKVYLGKYGPSYSQVNQQITYELYVGNYGSEIYNNMVMIETIPPEVTITQVFPGNFGIRGTNDFENLHYQLLYSTDGVNYFPLGAGIYNYGGNPYWGYIPIDNTIKVTNIKWIFETVDESFIQFDPPRLNGIVNNVNVPDTVNSVSAFSENDPVNPLDTKSVTTTLDNISAINGKKVNFPTGFVESGDIITLQGIFNGDASRIPNPILIDYVPKELKYSGNVIITYTNYFNQWQVQTIDINGVAPNPTVDIIVQENYDLDGRTKVEIKISNFTLEQRGNLFVSFDTTVKVGTKGTINNQMILANYGDSSVENGLLDTNDIDGDGITNETLLQSNIVTNTIGFSKRYNSDKKVKGSLDTEYSEEPIIGKTYDGGNAFYKLIFDNTSNTNFQDIVIVDILPHNVPPDTGVIQVNQLRGSEFNVYLGNIIKASIKNQQTGDPAPEILIEYSTSYDPPRFDIVGTGTWTTTPPTPITDVKSFKITTIGDTIIKPGQSLVLDIEGVVPIGTSFGLVAWNSFAVQSSYYNENNVLTPLNPVEPEKVGIEVIPVNSQKVSLGNYTWIDTNRNGVLDPGEVGINGVKVNLHSKYYNPYDEEASLLATTTTANDDLGNPGYYIFKNLDPDKYFIKFIPPEGYSLTVQNLNTNVTGSKPNPETGVTNVITTVQTPGSEDMTIDAGVYVTDIPASIGNLVWVDKNRNGEYEPGEKGQPNVLISLYTSDGKKTNYSAITDLNGNYQISGISPGSYKVVFSSIPQDNVFITKNDYVTETGMRPLPLVLSSGENRTDINAPIAFNEGQIGPVGPIGPQGPIGIGLCCTCSNANLVCFRLQTINPNLPIDMGNFVASTSGLITNSYGNQYVTLNEPGTYLINYYANVCFVDNPEKDDYIAIQLNLNNKLIPQGFGYTKENGIITGTALVTSQFSNNKLALFSVGPTTINLDNIGVTIIKVS